MPMVSEEEWNEDQMVWLTYRQILAVALILNEVQRCAPEDFSVAPELLKEISGVKVKLWAEVKPLLLPEEVKLSELED